MGQTPLQSGCQPNCSYADEAEATLEPRYPEATSFVVASARVDLADDWQEDEESAAFHCGPLADSYDWQTERACHCGVDDDSEVVLTQEPVYPELGSYIRKTQLSQELVSAQLQDVKSKKRRLTQDSRSYGQARSRGLHQTHDDSSSLINFTPQFFSSMQAGCQACQYTPDFSDDIDVEVKCNLDALDHHASRKLCILRRRAGVYEIDGRCVAVYWGGGADEESTEAEELCVHEVATSSSSADDMPLSLYLQQVANVLVSTRRGSQGPLSNMTFATIGMDISKLHNNRCASFSKDRDQAMRTACSQAAMRKMVQEHFRFGLNGMAIKV
jgi:hypothetical protein